MHFAHNALIVEVPAGEERIVEIHNDPRRRADAIRSFAESARGPRSIRPC